MTAMTAAARQRTGLSRADRTAVLAAAREVTANGRSLRGRWTTRLRAAGTITAPDGGIPEAEFLAPGGGYRVPADMIGRLPAPVRELTGCRAAPDGWACLRGYGYYSPDAVMYLPGRVPPVRDRWEIIESRWPRYARYAAALAPDTATERIPWLEWLSWLTLLETVQNDLAAASWTARTLADAATATICDRALAAVGALLADAAWHLWNDPPRARPASWAPRLAAVAADPAVRRVFTVLGRQLDDPAVPAHAVRAVREGDITWQACASWETCWQAIRAAHPSGRFLLASEAFGAITAGPLWRGLMTPADQAATTLAAVRGSIHEEEMRRVPRASWRTGPGAVLAAGRVVVHLDDGVFTGRTHGALLAALDSVPEAVYLAAMTLDVSTAINHPEEITSLGVTVAAHMEQITALARTPSGQLPAAPSMWARRKRPADDPAARVAGGSDRLLAALWHRYAEDIHAR